ncbi:MAG: RagB/SusD family nutrient uptake outer membrane protein, partial [Paludibacteraceae bacterium]|nr:RagB/SusD family nutrient uptake outer membrane protein [Paludibacteraceae bacterium]
MKNMNNKYLNIFGVLLVAFTFHACINDLDVTPINPQVTQTFNQDQVFAKVYAAYALTGQEGPAGNNDIDIVDEGRFSLYRSLWNCNELSTDESACAWGDAEVIDLNQNTWTAGNFSTEALYARLYFIVSISNHFLEETAGITDEKTVKQRAEVKFLRALAYYYLMDNFGNVPFTTIVGTEMPHQIKRADLFAWIKGELIAIEKDMYEPRQAPYYRVDKAANWLLQARLYLNAEVYTGTAKWDSAAIYAKKVIDSGYQLAPTYRHLFMGDNAGTLDGSSVNSAPQEIIFPLAADGIKTQSWGLSLFLIGSTYTSDMGDWGTNQGWAGNRARQDLIKKFFPNPPSVTARGDTNMTMVTFPGNLKDDRALFFRKSRTLSIVNLGKFKEGYSVIKFSNRRADGGTPHDPLFVDMDVPFMRLAEAYLTYAEAVLRG